MASEEVIHEARLGRGKLKGQELLTQDPRVNSLHLGGDRPCSAISGVGTSNARISERLILPKVDPAERTSICFSKTAVIECLLDDVRSPALLVQQGRSLAAQVVDREGRDLLVLQRDLERAVDGVLREGLVQAAAARQHQFAAAGQALLFLEYGHRVGRQVHDVGLAGLRVLGG